MPESQTQELNQVSCSQNPCSCPRVPNNTVFWSQCFPDKETEAPRGGITHPRPHSGMWRTGDLVSSRCTSLQSPFLHASSKEEVLTGEDPWTTAHKSHEESEEGTPLPAASAHSRERPPPSPSSLPKVLLTYSLMSFDFTAL